MPGYLLSGARELSPAEKQTILGVKWTKSSTSTALVRTDDAAGLSFTPQRITGAGTTAGSSGFDDMPIYRDIRRCNVVNGVVTAYEGEAGFTMTPARGHVMVEIPRFYCAVTDSEAELTIRISDRPFEGASVSPLHRSTPGDLAGEERAYVSAYFLDSTARSSGAEAATRSTISLPTSWPDGGLGNGFIPSGIMTYATILMLYLVEVADWDSQSAVCSVGLSSATDVNAKSGSLGYHSGGDETAGWCVYRGLENLWGKTPTMLYGVLLFAQLNAVYRESAWSNKAVESGVKLPLGITEGEAADTGSGYITGLGVDADVPGIILPSLTAETATGIPDQYITSGLGTSDYLALYWGAVASVPFAPGWNEGGGTVEESESIEIEEGGIAAGESIEIAAVADPAPDITIGDVVGPETTLVPLGSGGIMSLLSALDVDCFFRLSYLPGHAGRKSYTVTFTERDGTPIVTQQVPARFPFATAPSENPTWDKGFFTGWSPDPRIAITKDTVIEPQFVLGQKKKLPVLGTYDTLEALQAAVPSPAQGDLYQVGTEPPYKVYIYVTADGWVDTGLTQE